MSSRKFTDQTEEFEKVVVEDITLSDGRRAERHTTLDADGNEIVEIFAEEKRPVKLEKRITRKHKNIVAEEIVEMVKDGEISHREVRNLEPKMPLQIVERIGIADHAKVVDGDYMRKDEVGKLVSDAVVDGVTALMENMDRPITHQQPTVVHSEPLFRAQSQLTQNVEEKQKSDMKLNLTMAGIIAVQMAFFAYMYLMG